MVARHFTRQMHKNYDTVYDRVFSGVKERNEGRPNHGDFDRLGDDLRKTLAPIKAHRDTVVAHWDDKQEPATVADLRAAMEHIERLLADLYFLSHLGTMIFELGGVAASIPTTVTDLAELILGEHRIRKAKSEDMNTVYMMGFDTWGEGQAQDEYMAGCRASPKYAKGTWFVLEDREARPVSSLITYELEPVNERPAIGIGSIATSPDQRKKGRASQLLSSVMRSLQDRDGRRVFFLHSDIDPGFYETFDFVRLPDQYQEKPGSHTMIHCSKEIREALLAQPDFRPPSYF